MRTTDFCHGFINSSKKNHLYRRSRCEKKKSTRKIVRKKRQEASIWNRVVNACTHLQPSTCSRAQHVLHADLRGRGFSNGSRARRFIVGVQLKREYPHGCLYISVFITFTLRSFHRSWRRIWRLDRRSC